MVNEEITQKYFAIIKSQNRSGINRYNVKTYSEETKSQIEKDRERIEGKFDAKFIYFGKLKDVNQRLNIERLVYFYNKKGIELDADAINDSLKEEGILKPA